MIEEVLGQLPTESTQQAVGYPSLFLLVALGSLVPVVPTGALVSTAAVVTLHQTSPFALLFVFAVASGAAFLGDICLYWLGQRGCGPAMVRSGWRPSPAGPLRSGSRRRSRSWTSTAPWCWSCPGWSPAGRIPVMLACLLGRLPLRQFARGDVPACLAWAATYQLIGILGGSLFDEPWEGVLAAVVLTLLISGTPALWRRLRARMAG